MRVAHSFKIKNLDIVCILFREYNKNILYLIFELLHVIYILLFNIIQYVQ